MVVSSSRRHIALFLAAVALPCTLLVVLGLRLISQERQLSQTRLADERARVVVQLRDALVAELREVEAYELGTTGDADEERPVHPATRLVAPIRDGRPLPPWETDPSVRASRDALSEEEFVRPLRSGERAEVAGGDREAATRLYRDALRSAGHPAQVAYVRLLLARVLSARGLPDQAGENYHAVLETPPGVADEHGVSFALYAAARLVRASEQHEAVLARIEREAGWGATGPTATYLMRDVLVELETRATDSLTRGRAATVGELVAARARYVEQVLELQRGFDRLGLKSRSADVGTQTGRDWVLFGAEPWLVTAARPNGEESETLLAVEAASVLRAAERAIFEDVTSATAPRLVTQETGEPLGRGVEGVQVLWAEGGDETAATQWRLQRRFYLGTLLMVVAATLFGGYLLWHDVRRELRLAEMRSQFVSSVSHELKTPLTAIRMFAETLQDERQPSRQARAEYAETIVNETERLSRLLGNVLDFSKIERNEKTYQLRPTLPAQVVRRTARALQYPLEQQGFELRLSVDDGLPAIQADADALEQAILNLLSNAMKYSGDSRTVDLRLLRRDGEVVIEVEDRGVGIPVREQARIVEKFYRVPAVEERQTPGTGLGLTIVDHIVRGHGGRLVVRSAVGEGTTMAIHLPLDAES